MISYSQRGTWLLLLFVLLGVLAPTAAILWFMNEAVVSQTEAAEQTVLEAYRRQLRLVRDQIDATWRARSETLATAARRGTGVEFSQIVTAGHVDSAIFLQGNRVRYPSLPHAPGTDPLAEDRDWQAARRLEAQTDQLEAAAAFASIAEDAQDPNVVARARQAQVRCLVRAGARDTAIEVIRNHLMAGIAAHGVDLQGRSIAADSLHLALDLTRPDHPLRPEFLQRLVEILNDYEGFPMPASQRLSLMEHAIAAADGRSIKFPTYEAERIAQKMLASVPEIHPEIGLQRQGEGEWVLALPEDEEQNRAIGIFHSSEVLPPIRALLTEQSSEGAEFGITPPGEKLLPESVTIGSVLPGWQVGIQLTDGTVGGTLAERRTASYLWAGYLIVAALAISGFLFANSFRRQIRLTRLKTDLVAAASHELKTPLASMRVLVDALLEDPSPDLQKTREYLHLMASENARLSRLIENFLTFSRIERNRQSFEFAEVEPADLVQTAAQTVRERYLGEGLHLTTEVSEGTSPAGLPLIRADRDALVSVLINLLDNALKYTGEEKHIVLRAFHERDSVVFEVEDNGIGISPRNQKRIFRRFYQVDQRLARETGGCGLGLSIVDFVVRAHGGEVSVKSRLGAGSRFQVRIPIASVRERTAA